MVISQRKYHCTGAARQPSEPCGAKNRRLISSSKLELASHAHAERINLEPGLDGFLRLCLAHGSIIDTRSPLHCGLRIG